MINKRNRKIIAIVSSSLAISLIAYYMNDILNVDAVYTSLFFVPVIMTGLWYYRQAIPLSVIFAVYFNILDISEYNGQFSVDQIFRGLIMILGGVLLYCLGRNLARKNRQLEEHQKLLSIEKERLRITLLSIGDGVISTDQDGNVTLINEVAQQLTGWEGNSAIGRPFAEIFNIVNEYTREKCANPVQKVLDTGKVINLANHTSLIARNSAERSIADSAAPIWDAGGEMVGVVMVFRDVTEEKRRQREIEYLSNHDQLTDLGNRRYFIEQLRRLDQEDFLPLAVIMGDVNGLKLTNDAFGHGMGDQLLQKTAEVLQASCRSDDIICRYGGDEFVLLLPRTNDQDTETVVRKMRSSLEKLKIGPVSLSMSLGWAVKEQADQSINDVIKSAEDYMYKRKLYESPSTRGSIVHSIMNTLKSNIQLMQNEHIEDFYERVAKIFNLNEEDEQKFKNACMLHDIGKIAVDRNILSKADALTPEEWESVRRHPEVGYRILMTVPAFADIAEYVLAHHERWDGKGYPKGLKGEEIPYLSRIISVTDAYDTMLNPRPHKEALSEDNVIREIVRNAGTQFDPSVAQVFVEKVLGRSWEATLM